MIVQYNVAIYVKRDKLSVTSELLNLENEEKKTKKRHIRFIISNTVHGHDLFAPARQRTAQWRRGRRLSR